MTNPEKRPTTYSKVSCILFLTHPETRPGPARPGRLLRAPDFTGTPGDRDVARHADVRRDSVSSGTFRMLLFPMPAITAVARRGGIVE